MKFFRFRSCLKITMALPVLIIALLFNGACAAPSTPKQPSETQSNELVIRYLMAPPQVMPLRGAEMWCVATDANRSELKYEWSATGGEIQKKDEPNVILWIAPKKMGNYAITVAVTNAKGVKVTKSVTVAATDEPAQHPIVYSLTCDNCKNMMEASRFNEYKLRCVAIDPNADDELHYTWFATLGKIKENGAYATWTLGAQFGNALVTVIVTDSKGHEAIGYLAVNVSCCK